MIPNSNTQSMRGMRARRGRRRSPFSTLQFLIFLCIFIIVCVYASVMYSYISPHVADSHDEAGDTPMDQEDKVEALTHLSTEELVGQVLMIGLPGPVFDAQTRQMLHHIRPGGVLLHNNNILPYKAKAPVKRLVAQVQMEAIRSGFAPPLVAIDHEGDAHTRFSDDTLTRFPSAMGFGVTGDAQLVRRWGAVCCAELTQLGIHMNLAPVMDVNSAPENPVINYRSFGTDQRVVSRLGRAFIAGCQSSGVAAVAKHFPGHGDVAVDSHLGHVAVNKSLAAIQATEFPPFRAAIDEGVVGVMSAHLACPAITGSATLPVTMSNIALQKVLREQLGFRGLTVSDDVGMMGLLSPEDGITDVGTAAVAAVNAGIDLLIVKFIDRNALVVYNALLNAAKSGIISRERLTEAAQRLESVRRFLRLKDKYPPARLNLLMPHFESDELPLSDARADSIVSMVIPMLGRELQALVDSRNEVNNEASTASVLWVPSPAGLGLFSPKGVDSRGLVEPYFQPELQSVVNVTLRDLGRGYVSDPSAPRLLVTDLGLAAAIAEGVFKEQQYNPKHLQIPQVFRSVTELKNSEFFQFNPSSLPTGSDDSPTSGVLYYHVAFPDEMKYHELRALDRLSNQNSINGRVRFPIVIVSSGNPFPLQQWALYFPSVVGVLHTFSSSPLSLTLAFAALNGVFTPRVAPASTLRLLTKAP